MATDLYTLDKLTFSQLKLLYPSDNIYKDDITLATHLTESLLVESMDWEDDAAIGETAFWLKIFSVPKDDEHRERKVRFKREIYHLWSNNQTQKDLKADIDLKRSIDESGAGEASSGEDDLAPKRPRHSFERKIVSPVKRAAAPLDNMDTGIVVSIGDIDEEQTTVIEGTAMTADEWAVIEASLESSTSTVTATPHADAPRPSPTKKSRAPPQTLKSVTNDANLDLLRIYGCPHCQYKGESRVALDTHKYTLHLDIYPIACKEPDCEYRAKQQWILNRHIVTKHTTEKRFKCSACEFAAKTHQEVQRHIQSKHEAVMWKCDKCAFECDINKKIVRHKHVAKAHGDLSGMHQCKSCNYYTTTRGNLLDHINSRHSQSVKYMCKKEDCAYWSYSKTSVKQHMTECFGAKGLKKSHKKERKPVQMPLRAVHKFWCSECGMLFRYLQLAVKHIDKCHDGGSAMATNATKPGILYFVCSVCGEKSEDKTCMDTHGETVHPEGATIAGKYVEDENYTPTYIKCSHCDFSTTTWCGMRSHVRSNHSNEVYKCNICDFMTHSKNGITSHKRYRHLPKPQPNESKLPSAVSSSIANNNALIKGVASDSVFIADVSSEAATAASNYTLMDGLAGDNALTAAVSSDNNIAEEVIINGSNDFSTTLVKTRIIIVKPPARLQNK